MKTEPQKELIALPEESKPRLAVLTRVYPGRKSRAARLSADLVKPVKRGQQQNAKVCHVGRVVTVTTWTDGKSETKWKEVENLAEFDGPTCEDAANVFLSLLGKCTPSTGAHCVADGRVAPVKPWRERKHESASIRYIEAAA